MTIVVTKAEDVPSIVIAGQNYRRKQSVNVSCGAHTTARQVSSGGSEMKSFHTFINSVGVYEDMPKGTFICTQQYHYCKCSTEAESTL